MISITEKAAKRIRDIKEESDDFKGSYLRIQVIKGGCSGMSYKLDFDQSDLSQKDNTFDINGIKIVIDSNSLLYIDGLILDFSGGLNGKGFEFSNPNASKTCGCGISFAL